jgi:diaminopimelate decarboxylase
VLLRPGPDRYADALQQSRAHQLIDQDDTALIFIDLDILDNRLSHLTEAFPPSAFHAAAIKAHPMFSSLEHIAARGYGLEAASIEEVALASAAGVPAERIVFDSPVKTDREISWCAGHMPGMILNVNSLDELDRIPAGSDLRVGIRVNPLVDAGSPEVFQVSGHHSKFGVPITDREAVIRACLSHPAVCGLHLHVGSEISRPEVQAMAIRNVYHLALEIDRRRAAAGVGKDLTFLDIGGGFPARYEAGEQGGFSEYVAAILELAPELFHRYQVITEFGRFIFAHCAWLWSQIEYLTDPTDSLSGRAMLHAGADLFVREIYMPGAPVHQITVLDEQGQPKSGPARPYDLAGPLCFGGDFLGKDMLVPALERGDQIVVGDIGANSFALWSRHCSRRFPKVIALSSEWPSPRIVRPRETLDDIIRFWRGTPNTDLHSPFSPTL